MKLHVAGLFGIIGLSAAGCGLGSGAQAKVPVGTTTVTNAPMTPDGPLPAAIWEEDDEPVAPPIETWGVRPPTPEDLATYGF
jgi:hypothetical protein